MKKYTKFGENKVKTISIQSLINQSVRASYAVHV